MAGLDLKTISDMKSLLNDFESFSHSILYASTVVCEDLYLNR